MPIDGDLRVWWIPQVPMESFKVLVKDIETGQWLLNILAQYDLFQLEHRVKPDYCNVGGIEIFEDGEWREVDEE